MDVAKIQLKDMARTWWLAEEARLDNPISWDQFSKITRVSFLISQEGNRRAVYQTAIVEPVGG